VPTLKPGAVVLGVRARKVQPGDIVIVRHDDLDKIKRVKEVQLNKIFLTGDNSLQSTDSRDFGWLESDSVMVKVVWIFKGLKI
jgi:phage repressor protein C with HTH and peptisase S24 domain